MNAGQTLLSDLKASDDFSTAPQVYTETIAPSASKIVALVGKQFSFNQTHSVADIDIDIGNVNAKGTGGRVYAEEVIQNGLFKTTTSKDIVRKLLINNPKVQTITPSSASSTARKL